MDREVLGGGPASRSARSCRRGRCAGEVSSRVVPAMRPSRISGSSVRWSQPQAWSVFVMYAVLLARQRLAVPEAIDPACMAGEKLVRDAQRCAAAGGGARQRMRRGRVRSSGWLTMVPTARQMRGRAVEAGDQRLDIVGVRQVVMGAPHEQRRGRAVAQVDEVWQDADVLGSADVDEAAVAGGELGADAGGPVGRGVVSDQHLDIARRSACAGIPAPRAAVRRR